MKTTLAERITEAMAGPPRVSGKDLAKACKVAPASVSGWRTGKTQSIEGANLVRAAQKLNVSEKWLATGIGPKSIYPAPGNDDLDPCTIRAIEIFKGLSPGQREGALANLKMFAEHLGAHHNGHPLSMAG